MSFTVELPKDKWRLLSKLTYKYRRTKDIDDLDVYTPKKTLAELNDRKRLNFFNPNGRID